MRCDIIIPVWNQHKLTKDCVNSIVKHTHYPYRLKIIDNGSSSSTASYLEEIKRKLNAQLIRNEENRGFIRAVNQGLEVSDAPFVCIVNNDTAVTDGWLTEMVNIANSRADIGLVNPSSNNLGQQRGTYTVDEYAAQLKSFKGQYIELGSCVGFCMLIKKEVLGKIGYFDETFRHGNFDDTDYSRRAEKAGYLSVRAKGAYVYHHMRASFSKVDDYDESFKRNQEIYNMRWGKPKRILYIVTKRHDKLFSWMQEDIVKKVRGGNWVWLFFKGKDVLPQIQEHSNLKLVHIPRLFFAQNCVMKIMQKKKRFDTIYADNPDLVDRIKKLNKYHKADTTLIGG